MAIFKRRTFKTVGTNIGASIRRQKQKEKIARTLEKERAERENERTLNERIKKLKVERRESRPGMKLFRKAVKGAKGLSKKRSKKIVRRKPLKLKDLF